MIMKVSIRIAKDGQTNHMEMETDTHSIENETLLLQGFFQSIGGAAPTPPPAKQPIAAPKKAESPREWPPVKKPAPGVDSVFAKLQNTTELQPTLPPFTGEQIAVAPATIFNPASGNQPITNSRQLPLIGQETRSAFSLAEVAKIKEGVIKDKANPVEAVAEAESPAEKPDYWETGIKTDADGTKRYNCRYYCDCGAKGTHYIPLGIESVRCHECKTELAVDTATFEVDEQGVPVPNQYKNFFVAREAY